MGKLWLPDHKFWLPTLHARKAIILKRHKKKKFSNPLYVKGTGCFLKVPCKFQICNVQVHYQYIIIIKLVPRRSFGNMAKSTFSAFTTDDGFKFSINLLAEFSSSGRKIHVL